MIMTKRTFFSLLYALICIVSFGQEFVHPGMLHTTSDLEFMKAKVLAGEAPWKEAWSQLKSSEIASLNYKPTPFKVVDNGPYNKPDNGGKEFVRDGAAAYTMALQWYVEGDKAYAEKAVEIFNAWAQTLESVVNHNRQLKVGTAGIKYLNAAEIIKHTYKGWNAKDRKAFEDMVINIWYPVIKDWTPRYNGNWDAANGQTLMCIGIFLDRRDIFDTACKQLTDGDTNGAIKNYFYESGQCQESGRDQQHVQMGLAFLACAAEIAWNQDIDLYGAFDNRLYKGFEYTARYMSGEEVPHVQYITWFGKPVYGPEISSKQREKICPAWERAYHHYHDRKGMDMPYTRKMIQKSRPEGTANQSFMPWASLTSAGLPVR